MLGGIWNFIRANFKKRSILYALVVYSLTIFGSFPTLEIKLAFLLMFFAASGFFMPIFATQFLSKLRQILIHRRRKRVPLPNEMTELSKRIGGQFKELGIVEGRNAYVVGKTLVLGKEILEQFDFNRIQAVVAHESGHIKEKHGVFRFLAMVLLLLIPWYSWSRLYSPIFFTESLTQIMLTVMVGIAFLAYMTFAMIPVNWYLEARADRIAANFVGKEHIKSALLALTSKENLEEPSEDHPSTSERVKLGEAEILKMPRRRGQSRSKTTHDIYERNSRRRYVHKFQAMSRQQLCRK